MSEKKETDLLLLINGSLKRLPQKYSDWIDEQKSLPVDVLFFPRRISWFSMIAGFGFGTVCIGFMLFTWYYTIRGLVVLRLPIDWVALAIAILFTLLFLYFGIGNLLRFWSEINTLYAKKKGHLRQGLFLGNDSLLLWHPIRSCDLIPRKIIKSVKRESLSSLNYNGTLYAIRLIFDDEFHAGIEKYFGPVKIPSKYVESSDDEVIRKITNWIDEYSG